MNEWIGLMQRKEISNQSIDQIINDHTKINQSTIKWAIYQSIRASYVFENRIRNWLLIRMFSSARETWDGWPNVELEAGGDCFHAAPGGWRSNWKRVAAAPTGSPYRWVSYWTSNQRGSPGKQPNCELEAGGCRCHGVPCTRGSLNVELESDSARRASGMMQGWQKHGLVGPTRSATAPSLSIQGLANV